MATLTNRLTSISFDLRSGPSPGRRTVALLLCAILVVTAISPGIAAAGEVDSEGEGAALPVEAPIPDLDPGGEETDLEEAPAVPGSEDGSAEPALVEAEPELDTEAPSPSEVTGATTEAVAEEAGSQPPTVPEVEAAPAEPEYVPQAASASEPVENQALQAPKQADAKRDAARSQTAATTAPGGEATGETQSLPVEPTDEEAPTPATAPSDDSAVGLAGKRFYVVRPGDCLTYIAEALLPAGATEAAIEDEVDRLWRLNEERIGTGDPDVIYVGTVLTLR